MILFAILSIMFLILLAVAIVTISIGGAAFAVVFGDLIVCAVFIVLIIKRLIRRKKK